MMRRPTPPSQLFAWHRWALEQVAAGSRPRAPLNEPQCGWFRCRMVRKGPWCPGRIWMHQAIDAYGDLTEPEELRAEILGRPWSDVNAAWERLAGGPIPKAEFERLMREHLTNPVYRATHAPVDLSKGGLRP